MWRKGKFTIDDVVMYEGYTAGDTWNGFACPWFEKSVAEQILKDSEARGYMGQYEAEGDAFLVSSADSPHGWEPEIYNAVIFHLRGREIKAYGLGAYTWIWSEVEA